MTTKRMMTRVALLAVGACLLAAVGCADVSAAYRKSQRSAREAVLRENLFVLRHTIDRYLEDKGYYPASLETLVDEHYLPNVPVDPILQESQWDLVEAPPDASLGPPQSQGIFDVRSRASGETLDGIPYGKL